jgi:hypothetical protein
LGDPNQGLQIGSIAQGRDPTMQGGVQRVQLQRRRLFVRTSRAHSLQARRTDFDSRNLIWVLLLRPVSLPRLEGRQLGEPLTRHAGPHLNAVTLGASSASCALIAFARWRALALRSFPRRLASSSAVVTCATSSARCKRGLREQHVQKREIGRSRPSSPETLIRQARLGPSCHRVHERILPRPVQSALPVAAARLGPYRSAAPTEW